MTLYTADIEDSQRNADQPGADRLARVRLSGAKPGCGGARTPPLPAHRQIRSLEGGA